MRVVADLETVVGGTATDLLMPRNSLIQFQYHRMPILDWRGIDASHSMKADTLTLPLVPQRHEQLTQAETFYVTTYHPQALFL